MNQKLESSPQEKASCPCCERHQQKYEGLRRAVGDVAVAAGYQFLDHGYSKQLTKQEIGEKWRSMSLGWWEHLTNDERVNTVLAFVQHFVDSNESSYKVLFEGALDCVDKAFELLPGFCEPGEKKFAAVIRLAAAYKELTNA